MKSCFGDNLMSDLWLYYTRFASVFCMCVGARWWINVSVCLTHFRSQLCGDEDDVDGIDKKNAIVRCSWDCVYACIYWALIMCIQPCRKANAAGSIDVFFHIVFVFLSTSFVHRIFRWFASSGIELKKTDANKSTASFFFISSHFGCIEIDIGVWRDEFAISGLSSFGLINRSSRLCIYSRFEYALRSRLRRAHVQQQHQTPNENIFDFSHSKIFTCRLLFAWKKNPSRIVPSSMCLNVYCFDILKYICNNTLISCFAYIGRQATFLCRPTTFIRVRMCLCVSS